MEKWLIFDELVWDKYNDILLQMVYWALLIVNQLHAKLASLGTIFYWCKLKITTNQHFNIDEKLKDEVMDTVSGDMENTVMIHKEEKSCIKSDGIDRRIINDILSKCIHSLNSDT